jgi:hypothetical protein
VSEPVLRILACLAILTVVGTQTVLALPLPPDIAIFVPAEPDPIGGTLIAGGVPVPFTAATFSGTLISSVIAGDTTNPYGGLTFTYFLTNNAASPHEIHRFTVSSFASYQTDVSFQPPQAPGGVIPTFADRSDGVGDVIGFGFIPLLGGALKPGQSSVLMVVQTDAQTYHPTLAAVIDGSVAMVSSFAPLTIIPEPSTLVLGAIGLVGLAFGARMRPRTRG